MIVLPSSKSIMDCLKPSLLANISLIVFALVFISAGELKAAPLSPPEASQAISENPGTVGRKLDELIHQDPNSILEVPPVYKRPLGVDAGPRLHVKKFIVTGVKERPKLGITQEIVDTGVERLRLEMQQINAMNEYGLTQKDLDAMGKSLKKSLYADDEEALEEHAAFLQKLRKDKKFREEMSIGQLQEVANQVTDLYRNSGFVIAQAYVPEQTVEDGVVTIHVHEGTLGKTIVTNNKFYSTEIIKRIFKDLEGKSVTKHSLEDALLSLSDYPGLVAYGVLQPGENTGETDLVIKVQEEEKHNYTVRVDNYGTESTGENRLTLSYDRNNLFGNADSLNISLLQAFSPTNNLFGGFKYSSPVFSHDTIFGFGFSDNAYDVGGVLSNLDINGEVTSVNVFVSHQFIRSRTTNIYGKADLTNKVAETLLGDTPFTEDEVTPLTLEFGFDILDTKYKGINQGSVKFTQGFEGLLGARDEDDERIPSRLDTTGDYTKLNWNVARLQLIDKYQNLLFRFSGQYSDDLLVPVEQAGLGGPNNVRAFTPSEFLTDSTVFLSVDWNFNAPFFYNSQAFDGWKWGEILQFSVFADYARGEINEAPISIPDTVNISGYGVAVQMLLPGQMQIRLDIAKPSNGIDEEFRIFEEEVQYYLMFSYTG
jgi:hemolysin activation/secretion protein